MRRAIVLERTLVQNWSRSLVLMFKSAQQRLRELEQEFEEETKNLGAQRSVRRYEFANVPWEDLARSLYTAIQDRERWRIVLARGEYNPVDARIAARDGWSRMDGLITAITIEAHRRVAMMLDLENEAHA